LAALALATGGAARAGARPPSLLNPEVLQNR
jgi:hypothetical protein